MKKRTLFVEDDRLERTLVPRMLPSPRQEWEMESVGSPTQALAAKEMGGAQVAHSDGPRHGATFTLDRPSHSPANTL
jgi:hypothetical protein